MDYYYLRHELADILTSAAGSVSTVSTGEQAWHSTFMGPVEDDYCYNCNSAARSRLHAANSSHSTL